MSEIEKRLVASVKMDALNGNHAERDICGKQMLEAATELSRLKEELAKAKEENRYLLVEAKAELEWFQRSWCDDHPMSEGGINRVHRLISRIDVALKEAGK